jgi:hypothetical protein
MKTSRSSAGSWICASRDDPRDLDQEIGQVGVSEAVRNAIGRDGAPGSVPVDVRPAQRKKGRDDVANKIIPLFEDTDCLAALSTGRLRDKKLDKIGADQRLHAAAGLGGLATATSGDPYKNVALDEVDKYEPPRRAGRRDQRSAHAHPHLRGSRREDHRQQHAVDRRRADRAGIRSLPDQAVLLRAVPALRHDSSRSSGIASGTSILKICPTRRIARRGSSRRNRAGWNARIPIAPRPIAAATQNRSGSAGHPRAPQAADAAGRLLGNERRPLEALVRSHEGQKGEEGEQPEGDKVGVYVWRGYDLSGRWFKIAAAFVECDGNAAKLRDFYKLLSARNGKIWRRRHAVDLPIKCNPDPERDFTPPPARQIPLWASRLLMAVDTQKDRYYWVIRAFGPGFRSQRIDHGEAPNLADHPGDLRRELLPVRKNRYGFQPQRCHRSASTPAAAFRMRARTPAAPTSCISGARGSDPPPAAQRRQQAVRGTHPLATLIRQDPRQKRDPYESPLAIVPAVLARSAGQLHHRHGAGDRL